MMLELDADRRPTAEKALSHPYLGHYADPNDEPVAVPFDDSWEDSDQSLCEWKSRFLLNTFYLNHKNKFCF